MILLSRSGAYYFINSPSREIPREVLDSLEDATSDYIQNFERTDKYIRGEWDGKFHLLKTARNGSLYFPCGLLGTVIEILRTYDVEFVVRDAPIPENEGSVRYTWNKDYLMRDYQIDILKALIADGGSGVVSLPTGAGKTVIALRYAYSRGLPFMVVVHRAELLRQWEAEIRKILLNCDAWQNKHVIQTIGDGSTVLPSGSVVCIAMVQSLYSQVKRGLLREIKYPLVIFDECHTIAADTMYSVSMRCSARYRLGLSATPSRTDNQDKKIFGACGSLVSDIRVEDLVKRGFLAKPVFKLVKNVGISAYGQWSDVYRMGIVQNPVRNAAIIEEATRMLFEGRQVYIHVNQINHGKRIAAGIRGAEFVSAESKDREELISKFASGEIKCLVSTLLKEGVSIDGISGLIYASGGKSEVSCIQTIGRSLRPKRMENGSPVDALIVDFVDSGHKHLVEHSKQRIETYRKVYGKLFPY